MPSGKLRSLKKLADELDEAVAVEAGRRESAERIARALKKDLGRPTELHILFTPDWVPRPNLPYGTKDAFEKAWKFIVKTWPYIVYQEKFETMSINYAALSDNQFARVFQEKSG